MNPQVNRGSRRLLPAQTGILSANQVPLHGASRTTRLSRRSSPVMSTRRAFQRPLPPATFPHRNISSSSLDSSSTGSPPSPTFPVKSIEKALQTVEDRLRSELNGFRVSCSQVLVGEQLRAEKLRAQSIAYQRERDFAWAKVKALMAEKLGAQLVPPAHNARRSRSCGGLPQARPSRAAARRSCPSSRHVSPQPVPFSHPSMSSSASSSTSSLIQVKTEEEPVSLSSSRSASPWSPSETLVADDSLMPVHLEPIASSSDADPTPLPVLKRCHSDPSMAKAALYRWIELPDGTRVALTEMKNAQSYTLTNDHLNVIFKEHHNNFICRMCMLERKKLDQEEQSRFRVASFDTESSSLEKFTHCLRCHSKESEEMAKLPHSMLLEMQKGLAKTERDEDFDLDYTLML